MNRNVSINNLEWKETELVPVSWHKAKELEVDGWKLPTRKQIKSIYQILPEENDKMMHGFVFFDYWTSDLYLYNKLYAWFLGLESGKMAIKIKSSRLYVRLCKPRNVRMC